MEITGTGGLLLLVVAVLWLGFMTPSGKSGLRDATKRRTRVDRVVVQTRAADKQKIQVKTHQNPWYLADVAGMQQNAVLEPEQVTKVEVNRLPDPLSARLGKIESVQWAEIREINKAREVKENLTSESLDEILQRRRSNG
jgi:hypothetical protein